MTNSGRFGPYVQHRTLYAPLPKGSTPQEVTFEEAVELLTAKAARMRARGRDPYMVRFRVCNHHRVLLTLGSTGPANFIAWLASGGRGKQN